MNSEDYTLEEGQDLDFILGALLKLEATHHSSVAQIFYLYKTVFPQKGEHYIVDIIYKGLSYEPKVITCDRMTGTSTAIWPTPLLKDFLDRGGFAAIAKSQECVRKQKEEFEKLNLEKLRYDVKNSRRIFKTYWWTFFMALIGLAVSLTLGIIKILTDK